MPSQTPDKITISRYLESAAADAHNRAVVQHLRHCLHCVIWDVIWRHLTQLLLVCWLVVKVC